jgi:hypothetical protein
MPPTDGLQPAIRNAIIEQKPKTAQMLSKCQKHGRLTKKKRLFNTAACVAGQKLGKLCHCPQLEPNRNASSDGQ